MPPMERRIVQIFQRKKAIIDQAKHQVDLFDQSLVSQLLVAGINPPTWLWTPLFQTQNFDCAGLPKDPKFAIPSYISLENKVSEAEKNAQHVEFPVPSENLEERASTLLPVTASGPRVSLQGPNLDSSPIHLQDKIDATSDNVPDPALSLARLQRSKPRQRALGLRNSAKSAKRLQDEKNDTVLDCRDREAGTAITSIRSNHVHQVELVKPSDTNDVQERNGVEECDHIEEGPITRSRLSRRENSSFNLSTSGYICDADEKAHAADNMKFRQQSTHASGKLEFFSSYSGPIETDSAIFREQQRETRSRQIEEEISDSCPNYDSANIFSVPCNSFSTLGDDGIRVRPTTCYKSVELQNRNEYAILEAGNQVDGCAAGSIGPFEHGGEQSGAKSVLAAEDTVEPVNSSCTMGHEVIENQSSSFKKIMPIHLLNKFQEGIQENTNACNTIYGPRLDENIAGTAIATNGSLNPLCVPFSSKLDCAGIEVGREVILSRMSTEMDSISSDALDFLEKQYTSTNEGKLEGESMLSAISPETCALQPNLSRDLTSYSPAAALEVEKIVILEQHNIKSGVPQFHGAEMQFSLADKSVEAATKGFDSALSTEPHMQKNIDDQLKNPMSVSATPEVEEDPQFITGDFIDGTNEEDCKTRVHVLPSSKAHGTLVNDLSSYTEGIDTNNGYMIEDSESSPELPVEKDEAILEVQDGVITSITDLSKSPSFGLVTKSVGGSDCLEAKEGLMNTGKQHVILENQESLQRHEGLSLGDSEHFTSAGNTLGKRYHLEGKHQLSSSSVSPLQTQASNDNVDETMPVLERFLVQSDDKRVVKEDINFEKLNLSSSIMERVGFLEQLCNSASVYTPLASSNTYKFHTLMNDVQSVPGGVLENDGILERMDVESCDSMNETMKLLEEEIYTENAIQSCGGSSNSERPLNLNDQFASNLRNYYVSPVGKLWNRITSDSIISEKSGSLNSELPCIREEDENGDAVTDTLSAAIAEDQITQSIQRVPLANITEMTLPNILASDAKICGDKCGQYSVDIDTSINGHQQPTSCNEQNSRVKAALDGNGAKGRFTRTKLLGETDKECEILLKKGTKPSNIVSNITSFIPLVQKKQLAAVVKGKRDIKVKALDAAEAAKRLAEEKENERKLKKEAMKIERGRMEQENLKQLEMLRKKKEEEQKKKEADIAAKKRQREEEERKDKARKRLRTEELRKRRRELNEKSIVEKGIGCHPKDRKARSETEWKNDIKIVKKDQQMDSLKEISEAERRTDADSTIDTGKSNIIHVDCGSILDNCNEIKGLNNIDHLTKNLELDTSQHLSYEISPFKCSDDEEEEEEDDDDEMLHSKFIPSWASKNSLALGVASQLTVNSEQLFQLKSFCHIDEIVTPRKSQLK